VGFLELKLFPERKGVASVIGTLIFITVFMLALGSMAYASGLQAQSSQAEQQSLQVELQKGTEGLGFTTLTSGLWATDSGPSSVSLKYVVLKFPNGTVYPLSTSTSVAAGGRINVQGLIPPGICSPGQATCLSKYKEIASGVVVGSSLGLVTSLGNSFWYSYAANQVGWNSLTGFPRACPDGESIVKLNTTLTCAAAGPLVSVAKTPVTTVGSSDYISTNLSVRLAANTSYVFYAFTAIEPNFGIEDYNFEIHPLPSGAVLVLACSPMSYPYGGGNQPTNCVSASADPIASANTLAFGVSPPVFATPGVFGMVSMGETAGILQIDFACTSQCGGVTMEAGSFMLVLPTT
jgi:hypothetical protein